MSPQPAVPVHTGVFQELVKLDSVMMQSPYTRGIPPLPNTAVSAATQSPFVRGYSAPPAGRFVSSSAVPVHHPTHKEQSSMNIAIPDCPTLPDRLVVGQKYRRPCVRAQWHGSYITWVPVIGPVHDDRKHIGAAFQHLHVDYRFLRPDIRTALERELHRSPKCSNRVFSTPVSNVSPLGLDDPISLDSPT